MNNIVSKSSATESIRSSVNNLNSVCDGIQCDEICDIIAHRFYTKHGMPNNKVAKLSCVLYTLCIYLDDNN